MPKKKKKKTAKPRKARKRESLDLRRVTQALSGVGKIAKKGLKEGDRFDTEANLPSMRHAVEELQAAVDGFKREIKKRMLADPRLKDGAIRTKDSIIHLKPRRGAKAGSKNPDDYDVVREAIQ